MTQNLRPTWRRLAALATVVTTTGLPVLAFAAPAQAAATGPELVLQQTHSPQEFRPGQPGQFTLTVTNVGQSPTTADTIEVIVKLSAGLSLASAPSGLGWTCTADNPSLVSCVTNTVLAANGGSANPITVPVEVAADATGAVADEAKVNGGSDVEGDAAVDLVLLRGENGRRPSIMY